MRIAAIAFPDAPSLAISGDVVAGTAVRREQPAIGHRRRVGELPRTPIEFCCAGLRLIAVLGVATMVGFDARTAHAATTDIYPDFAFAAAPGWQYQNYFDWANRGSTNSLTETPLLAYYTKTGVTGTTKDSFEFWVSASLGYQNTHHARDNSGWGVASPNLAVEWYYNAIQSDKTFGSDDYEALTISPWFQLIGPNGDTKTTGFGSGADQWSGNSTLLISYRKGRFTTTVAPITLTYSGSNLNSTLVANSAGVVSSVKARAGLSGAFGIASVGYDVTPTLTLAVQQAWNVYSFADARYTPRTSEGTIGPLVAYSGLSDSHGLYIAAAVQVDYHHSPGLPQAAYITTYITKNF
jgi:hypothetical protein